jgi:hypothetical protein
MKRAFPRASISLRNGALPATPSALMNMCLEQYVDADVDLVFVEYVANDGSNRWARSSWMWPINYWACWQCAVALHMVFVEYVANDSSNRWARWLRAVAMYRVAHLVVRGVRRRRRQQQVGTPVVRSCPVQVVSPGVHGVRRKRRQQQVGTLAVCSSPVQVVSPDGRCC